jgi:hypothetical protein
VLFSVRRLQPHANQVQLICILITGTIKLPLGNDAAIPKLLIFSFDDIVTVNRNI